MARKDYKQEYLEDFKMLSGITDLTLQDVFGAMQLMLRNHDLKVSKAGPWSKNQFLFLYQMMNDGDDFCNTGISIFKKAVEQTRYDRTHRPKKSDFEYPETPVYNPEEDMNAMSDELLKKDDVYYESFNTIPSETELFESWKLQFDSF